ncbi:MAG TPA: glycosyltransferase, partial [Vicinamibacterales bacterium]|nr:glycosyltransferase [Vicinamibacterales bacterium]
SDEEVRDLYRQSTAVLLPGVEDFGIVPVEAQACGTPVVALAEGGACESVVHGVTGILVRDPSAEAFVEGLADVQRIRFDRDAIRTNALRFSRERFLATFAEAVDAARGDSLAPRQDSVSVAWDRSRHGETSDRNEPAAREDAASVAWDQSRHSAPSGRSKLATGQDAASVDWDQSRHSERSDRNEPAAREDEQ